MSYHAITIAKHLTLMAEQRGRQLTHMQLQKLVFLAHGYHLGVYGRPLIIDAVVSWQYGPIIPALYRELKWFCGDTIAPLRGPAPMGNDSLQLLQAVFDGYGALTGPALSSLTHQPGSPWAQVWQAHLCGGSSQIPDALLARHYAVQLAA